MSLRCADVSFFFSFSYEIYKDFLQFIPKMFREIAFLSQHYPVIYHFTCFSEAFINLPHKVLIYVQKFSKHQ